MKTLVFFALFIILFVSLKSQTGKDCNHPYVISSLPFVLNNQSTQNMGNEYNETMACNSLYMTGNDFVFTYTPPQNMNITVELTNTNVLVGLFIMDGCPDNPTTQCIAKMEASNGNPKLSNIPVSANVTYYIIIDTYNVANLFPNTTFNISVNEAHTIDIAPVRFFRPLSGCHLNQHTPICIMTKNLGTQAIDTTILGFYLDNQTPVFDTFPYHFEPGDLAYFWFDNFTLDLSPIDKHLMTVFSATPGDANPFNDTLRKWIVHPENISVFPYFEDFEQSDGGWTTNWISDLQPGTSWEWGTPQGQAINHAASGSKCWATNLSGNYLAPEDSYILGPCFDFSQLTLPVIEFDIFFKTAIIDLIQLEYSLDSAFTWHQIGNPGEGINWYNTPAGYSQAGWNGNSNGWIHALHTLDGLGGKSYVLLRFTLRGGVNGTDEGVAIDNIKISESPNIDIAVKEIIYPYDSCGYKQNEPIKFIIQNNGLQTVQDIPIKISIDNGLTYVTEIIPQSLSFQNYHLHVTQPTFDLSNYGVHHIIIVASMPNDENPLNDTLRQTFMNFPIITQYPYLEDFELNNGYWFSKGMNNSWEWGIPNDPMMQNAASGTHCWGTNLSGFHNMAEESFAISPCFYLDGLSKPIFKSMIWYEQTYPTYTQVHIKNEPPNLWETLGSSNSPNWYNAGYSWTNSSNGWIQAKHTLQSYNDNKQHQLRFYFKGTVQNAGFAFDKVEICDAPQASFTTYSPTKSGYYVYFQNTSQRFDSCLWDFGDGQFSNELHPIHQYPSSDSVLVKLKVWSQCDIDSFQKYVYPIFISVPENQLNHCIKTYINQQYLIVEKSCNQLNDSFNLRIYTPEGKVLYSDTFLFNEPLKEIPLPINKRGIYLIHLFSDTDNTTIKAMF